MIPPDVRDLAPPPNDGALSYLTGSISSITGLCHQSSYCTASIHGGDPMGMFHGTRNTKVASFKTIDHHQRPQDEHQP
jgi:hypothetical protein